MEKILFLWIYAMQSYPMMSLFWEIKNYSLLSSCIIPDKGSLKIFPKYAHHWFKEKFRTKRSRDGSYRNILIFPREWGQVHFNQSLVDIGSLVKFSAKFHLHQQGSSVFSRVHNFCLATKFEAKHTPTPLFFVVWQYKILVIKYCWLRLLEIYIFY